MLFVFTRSDLPGQKFALGKNPQTIFAGGEINNVTP